jgi:hypothetical protein
MIESNNNNDSLTLQEIQKLLEALDKYSETSIVKEILQQAFGESEIDN